MDMSIRRLDLVATFLIGPGDQTVLVMNGDRWAPPVGSRKFLRRYGTFEEPRYTAMRATRRKTGISVRPDRIEYLGAVPKEMRQLHFFAALVEDFSQLLPYGLHGERTLRYPLARLPYDLDTELLEGREISHDWLNFLKALKSSPDTEGGDEMDNVRTLQREEEGPVSLVL